MRAPFYDTVELGRAFDEEIDRAAIITEIKKAESQSGAAVQFGDAVLNDLSDSELVGYLEELIAEGSAAPIGTGDERNVVVEGGRETAYNPDGSIIYSMEVNEQRIMTALDHAADDTKSFDDQDLQVLLQDGKDFTFTPQQRLALQDQYGDDNPFLDVEDGMSALEVAHEISVGDAAISLFEAEQTSQDYEGYLAATGKGPSSRAIADWFQTEQAALYRNAINSGYILKDGKKLELQPSTIQRMQTSGDWMGQELSEDEQEAVIAFRDSQNDLDVEMRKRLFEGDPVYSAMLNQGLMNTLEYGGMAAKGGYFQKEPGGFAGIATQHFGDYSDEKKADIFKQWWTVGGAGHIQAMYDQLDDRGKASVAGTREYSPVPGVTTQLEPIAGTPSMDMFIDDRGAPTQAGLTLMEDSFGSDPELLADINQTLSTTMDDQTYSSVVQWGDSVSVGERNVVVEGEAKNIALQRYMPGNFGAQFETIAQISAQYNVPWEILIGVMDMYRGEQEFTDPIAEAIATAQTLQEGMQTFGSMALAIWATEDPTGAAQMARYGRADPQLMAVGQAVLAQVTGVASDLLYDDPWLKAESQFIGATEQAVREVRLTDPARIREAMRSTYEALLLPVPSESEMASQIGSIHSAERASQAPMPQQQYNQQRFQDYKAYSLNPQEWYFPVAGGGEFSSSYGYDGGRSARGYVHGGIDIYAPTGTALVAPVSGKVAKAGQSRNAAGITVHIQGDDGKYYVMSHMNGWNVSEGQRVEGGQQVGTVGKTGSASGGSAHVHFEMHRNGKYNRQSLNPTASGREDPYAYLQATKTQGNQLITGQWDLPSLVSGVDAPQGDINVTRYNVDAQARIAEQMRGTPLYRTLYKNKPVGISDVAYGQSFVQSAQQVTGTPSPDTARIGVETGSLDTMFGHAFGDTEMKQSSSKFRDRLYRMSRAFNTAKVNR